MNEYRILRRYSVHTGKVFYIIQRRKSFFGVKVWVTVRPIELNGTKNKYTSIFDAEIDLNTIIGNRVKDHGVNVMKHIKV